MQRVQRAIPGLVVMAIMIATMGYGFTASNVTPNSSAGFGSGEIEGYTISSVRFTPASGAPELISGVTLDLDKPAETVNVVFPATAGGTGIPRPCAHFPTPARPYRWLCAVLESVESVEWLEVAAAQ